MWGGRQVTVEPLDRVDEFCSRRTRVKEGYMTLRTHRGERNKARAKSAERE